MRTVLYCRVSSLVQETRGTIATQKEFAARYCSLHKINILDTYSDDGVSGGIPLSERPAGSRLLADARTGKFDQVLIYSLSRLARNTLDTLNSIELLRSRGVAVKSLTEDFDTSTPAGRFFITALASMDQLTKDNIRDNSRRGMERLVREGRWVGGRAPFGYRISNGRLAIDPVQSDIVRDIFNWYLAGQRIRGIAARINASGIKHPMDWDKEKSRPWYEATVSKLLGNRVYIGEWFWRKRTDRKKVAGKSVCTKTTRDQQIFVSVPPIVSQEDFTRVQQTLKANFANSFRNTKRFYLLRALMYCSRCGSRYVGLASGRKPWIKNYYRCSSHVGANARPPCGAKAIRADLIEAAVWQHCVDFANDPSLVIDELRRTMAARQDNQGDIVAQVGQMNSALSAKARERAKVINLNRREIISDREAERELNLLRLETLELERRRAELIASLESAESSELRILTAETMLELMAEKIAHADDRIRREVVLAWIDRIEIETIGEGREKRPLAHVRYVFRPESQAVDSVEVGLATSNARFAES